MPEVDINFWAVLVAAATSMVVGSIWYGNVGFGKYWMKLAGLTEEKIKEGAGKAMGVAALLSVVQAYVLAHVVDYAEATTVSTGLMAGVWVWLGFVFTSHVTNAMFNQKDLRITWLFLGNALVTLCLQGLILAVWQ